MKIVITGALGHIGSSLIRTLPDLIIDSEFILIDNLLTQRFCSLFDLSGHVNYEFINANILEVDLNKLLEEVDIVIHLAAVTDATASYDNPEQITSNNLNTTKALADVCSKYNIRLIALSSTSVYTPKKDFIDENCDISELEPSSPYAINKLKEEKYIQKLVNHNALSACILRLGTIFGVSPGMRFHTAVNKFCWQASVGEPITIWETALNQLRPYLALNDAVSSIAHVINNDIFDGTVFNVVTTNTTVKDIIEEIKKYRFNTKIQIQNHKVMNNLSYKVSAQKLKDTGFNFKGDLCSDIKKTMQLFHSLKQH